MALIGARPTTQPHKRLICEGCGCTDEAACPGGCHWVSKNPPVCSACVDAAGELADGIGFGSERCPASPAPALHVLLWTSETEGYCTRCQTGFAT